jgi:predicted nucleotide-binding protein (sugar kinase/HSP70/actin superfamily)
MGGLTVAHDALISAGLTNVGYNIRPLDSPNNEAYQLGKEYGNRGQCNPTYFTVGNLVQYLQKLEADGLTKEEIVRDYLFLTAGACGPCRFGMYATEFRKALRDAGFDGFRVVLFQQQGGLSQATGEDSGLEFTPGFFINLLKGLIAGDVINGLGYRIRPYEVEAGATDRALEKSKDECANALRDGKSVLMALLRARKHLASVKVDRTKPKPKVSIIGEFWAMTTEGDGNYGLQRFLEAEGAECDVQLVTAWLLYNIWEVEFDTRTRSALRYQDEARLSLEGMDRLALFKRQVSLKVADKALRLVFQAFAHTIGFTKYTLPDMDELAEIAAPYYDNDVRGGEGHMEISKVILNTEHHKANMTLSVKPFGCMPSSSVSDGVQSVITEKFPNAIFCPVETSGDGAVNFYSRVQMFLFKAKQSAQKEFDTALEKTGLGESGLRAALSKHPRIQHSLSKAPHVAAATAADTVYEAARRGVPRSRRAVKAAQGLVQGVAAMIGTR